MKRIKLPPILKIKMQHLQKFSIQDAVSDGQNIHFAEYAKKNTSLKQQNNGAIDPW